MEQNEKNIILSWLKHERDSVDKSFAKWIQSDSGNEKEYQRAYRTYLEDVASVSTLKCVCDELGIIYQEVRE